MPGLAVLPAGDIPATYMITEAFEAADATTHVARSSDGGRTCAHKDRPYDKSVVGAPTSHCMKPTVLPGRSLIAMGYRFQRDAPEQSISIPRPAAF